MTLVKKIAKAINKAQKAFARPTARPTATLKIAVPALPTQEEIQALRKQVAVKFQAFLQAAENYAGERDSEAADELKDAARALGLPLNKLVGSDRLEAFCAAIEHNEVAKSKDCFEGISRIIDTAESLDKYDYTFLPDCTCDEDLGGYCVDLLAETGAFSRAPEWLREFIDCESLGESERQEYGGSYTNRGYFQFGEIAY